MRISGYIDKTNQKQHLFTALLQECQLASPSSRLSNNLCRRIEEFDNNERKDVVSGVSNGCAPLFLACKNGSADVVEYLISKCNAPIEQKGLFEVEEEGVRHSVTPLWCAAVSGRLAVVRVLLRHGADVNAVSDSGSTSVRSVCYIVRPGMESCHLAIIRALVTAGANIHVANHFGGTCLINSVQSAELVKFLIRQGADVNAEDVQHKTALHYAIQEHRLDTAKILVENGADLIKESKYGDDALQTACVKGALSIFNYLLDVHEYPLGRICDAFDLMGASFLLETQDISSSLFFWRKSIELRTATALGGDMEKPSLGPHPVLGIEEFRTDEELEELLFDMNTMRLQALIITERVLGCLHKDTIFRYMYAGAAHADMGEYRQCIKLWNYALGLKIMKETLLSSDTSFTVRAVIQLYMNILLREQSREELQFTDVLTTTRHINSGLEQSIALLEIQPRYKTQEDNFDLVLQCWLHLCYLLVTLACTYQEKCDTYSVVCEAKNLNPRGQNNESLLHLSVSNSSTIPRTGAEEPEPNDMFPSEDVVKYLLEAGYDPNVKNEAGETPLHVAAKKENYSISILSLLLRHGALLCAKDNSQVTPLTILQRQPAKLNVMEFISLKCLAVKVLKQFLFNITAKDIGHHCLSYFNLHS